MTEPGKYKKVYQNPSLTDILKLANDEDAVVPVWESTRLYSRIDIDNNYYVVGRTTVLWEDEQTGIVSADPRKFEKWLDSLSLARVG